MRKFNGNPLEDCAAVIVMAKLLAGRGMTGMALTTLGDAIIEAEIKFGPKLPIFFDLEIEAAKIAFNAEMYDTAAKCNLAALQRMDELGWVKSQKYLSALSDLALCYTNLDEPDKAKQVILRMEKRKAEIAGQNDPFQTSLQTPKENEKEFKLKIKKIISNIKSLLFYNK